MILVGTAPDQSGGRFVGNAAVAGWDIDNMVLEPTFQYNLAWAQEFTLSSAVNASRLAIDVNSNESTGTFALQLTNRIGPGTTAANVLAANSGFSFGAGPHSTNTAEWALGGLTLGAGTYYLVLSSSSPITNVGTADNAQENPPNGMARCNIDEPCGFVGGWQNGGPSVGAFGSAGPVYLALLSGNAAAALTDFDPNDSNPNAGNFTLYGDPAGAAVVPEPSSMLLVAGGAVAVGIATRRRR